MAEGWQDFYLLIGSAGAALIGLLFVVVTLTVGHERQRLMLGQRLYTSPIVFHLSMILLLSGAAMAPVVATRTFALLCGLVAALGMIVGLRIAIGICRVRGGAIGWDDVCWYGVAPTLVYFLLLGAAIGLCAGAAWGAIGVGALLMALLLLCIHNAWDLVTWLAPRAAAEASSEGGAAEPPPPASGDGDAEAR